MFRLANSAVFLGLILILLMGICKSDTLQSPSREEIIRLYTNAVVKVEHYQIGSNSQDWSGSAVFYTPRRLITNAHVIGSSADDFDDKKFFADEDLKRAIFWVVFKGKKYKAHIIGRDLELDLAILEVDKEIFITPAPLGNSDQTEIGEEVFAIGSPYGLENTITKGIISAKERITGLLSYEKYLQTDAPINPGNSGGPLVSLKTGKVIGIINSRIPFADGMGFAIPINLFHNIEKDLKETIKRSWLGINFPIRLTNSEGIENLITLYNLTGNNDIDSLKKIAEEIFTENKGGALITDIISTTEISHFEKIFVKPNIFNFTKTPAYQAELQTGDIIKKFNNYKIRNGSDLIYAIFMTPPYQKVKMTIVRFKKEKIEINLEITPILRLPSRNKDGFY